MRETFIPSLLRRLRLSEISTQKIPLLCPAFRKALIYVI